MTTSTDLDQTRLTAFEDRLSQALNDGALCLMISIGHRAGLFDAMATMPPSTSMAIARKAGLNERYVREWLGAMVASGVIEVGADSGAYRLPPEHAARLTRAATPSNMAVFAQYIPLLGTVEDDIVECFAKGGGVPYPRFTRFHEVMAEESGQTILPVLREYILPLVPGLIEKLEAGIRVLDVGCGRGRALNLMAQWFPRSAFFGYDLSEDATAFARREASEKRIGNVRFEPRDLSRFDEEATPRSFDFITTFDAIHDQARPMAVLRGIRRSLADDGVYLAQDIRGSSRHHLDREHPFGTLLYTISCMHCMTVSLAQEGEGLGAMWGRETAERYFRDAGFASVGVNELAHDVNNYYYVCRP
jgi:SAM-dependent methyltransferase